MIVQGHQKRIELQKVLLIWALIIVQILTEFDFGTGWGKGAGLGASDDI
jgi:hypothetical protein